MSGAASLELGGLVAGHGGVPVVRGLDLVVREGEVVALLGPNGAGKSTTLATIAGVLPRLGGSVALFGRELRRARPHRAARLGLGYLPESRGLFSQLTTRENLLVRARSRARVGELLERFPLLAPLANRRAGLLSGGEQQLLALACGIALEPRLLLLDELTMGLAPVIVRGLMREVRAIAQSGVAVLLVEQHVHAALELADRAYVLRHGECVMEGEAAGLAGRFDELYASYVGGEGDGAPPSPPRGS